MRRFTNCISFLAVLIAFAGTASAQGWGDLTGTFVLKGEAPEPELLKIGGVDAAFCTASKPVDESLVVGPGGGIRDIMIFLFAKPGDSKPPIHPDYAKNAKVPVVLNNMGCRFEPRVAMLQANQTLVLKNSDKVGHNTKIDFPFGENQSINPLIPANQQLEHSDFTAPVRLPASVSCSIHGWMKARLMIKEHPYMAVTGKDGKFTIKNVPEGEWNFMFYHDTSGYIGHPRRKTESRPALPKPIVVNGTETAWVRGVTAVKVKNGAAADLGKIEVKVEAFK